MREGERGGIRVHVGQPHSTVDEVNGDVVMLYYPLFWWMMQRRGTGGCERADTRSCGTIPFYSGRR